MRRTIFVLLFASTVFGSVRIGDLTNYPNTTPVTLTGYGLVIGLAGTGDGSKSTFTPQTFANMLKQFGIEIAPGELKLKNVAAVMVTCELPAGAKRGSRLDALVSSLGDATSLQGGTLLRTVLNDPWGEPAAEVQGPVSIGGFNFESSGTRVSRNHSVAGRIPTGVVLFADGPELPAPADSFVLVLEQPDLRNAVAVTRSVNQTFPDAARTQDPSTVVISVPEQFETQSERLEFQSVVEDLQVEQAGTDRIVINERTGTIVIGTEVSLLPTAVAHGNLTVEISEQPVISQPNAFGNGETVVERSSRITVDNAGVGLKEVGGAASAGEVARMLNSLGVSPRDMIAIFQGLKAAGALRAELVIM
ncbi:MAG: flagellar basal body P-ring protein FlgI [Calditrichaeota bacterium]|nr:flagellar basal body P-ring protein FlgI [Calditrichota bacterium]